MPHTILITGASKGIGLATTERLAKEGHIVHATTRHPEEAAALRALAETYDNIKVHRLDVTQPEQEIVAFVHSLGDLDILINNAGVGLYGPLETATLEQMQHVFNVNVFGAFKMTTAVLPVMRSKEAECTIINISSIVGPIPDPYQPIYSASKGALEHMMAVLRKNLQEAHSNIRVVNVNPGPVITEFEASTPAGTRFPDTDNPYPQMKSDEEKWRGLMRQGRPVEETVDTIIRVLVDKSAPYWNPTEQRVQDAFEGIYRDPSGNSFMAGLVKNTRQERDAVSVQVLINQQQRALTPVPEGKKDNAATAVAEFNV